MLEAGEPEENIAAVIQRMTSGTPPSDNAPTTLSPSATDARPDLPQIHALTDDPMVRAGSGALRALKGMAEMVRHPLDSAKAILYDAPAEMFEKSRMAETMPEKLAYGAAGALPLVGPMAAHAGEEIAAGRTPELMGEVGMTALLPSGARATSGAAKAVGSMAKTAVKSAAESELLARVAKRAARPMGAAAGAAVGGLVGMPTAGAVVGSEAGEMIRGAARKLRERGKPETVSGETSQLTEMAAEARELSRRLVLSPQEAARLTVLMDRLETSAKESGMTYAGAQPKRKG